ncbi:hypothetical protein [Nocardia farcinica]|uniref:hypothetical protein n=1 Tax=Nocardia farcinica TaxID=37329 RepID=UPI002458DB71|nr:hypothetical protein [Nocardia farcinica]
MGLWEDAQRRSRELDQQDANRVAAADRQRAAVAAQLEAVHEFVDAMHRLGIAPRKHKWYSKSDLRHAWFGGKHGWSVRNPRHQAEYGGLVVTPDHEVYNMDLYWKQKPLDLSQLHSFGGAYDSTSTTLVEELRNGLAEALRG